MNRRSRRESPVVDAVRSRRIQALHEVLDAGLDPGLPESSGVTPLMGAVVTDQQPAVELLLRRGADVARADDNAQDRHGNSPLWRAVFGRNASPPLLRLLLDRGADPARERARRLATGPRGGQAAVTEPARGEQVEAR